jgi:hypothetical protein
MNVVAPGGDPWKDSDQDGYVDGVLSTFWNFATNSPEYAYAVGTSQATPHVTGVAALLLGRGCPAGRIRTILENTATDLGPPGFDNQYGHGLINAEAAVNAAARDLYIQTLRGLGATSRIQLKNRKVVFTWRVKNTGCVATKATSIKFWLSADTHLGADDIPLGKRSVMALTGGSSTPLTQATLSLSEAVNANQRWYVIGQVDPGNLVGEANEGNNERKGRLTDK